MRNDYETKLHLIEDSREDCVLCGMDHACRMRNRHSSMRNANEYYSYLGKVSRARGGILVRCCDESNYLFYKEKINDYS